MTNKFGRSCAEPVNETLPQTMTGAKTDIPLSIISECIDPKLLLALSDKDGNILDQKEFNVESTTTPETGTPSTLTAIIIVVLLIIILIAMYMKKNNNKIDDPDIKLKEKNESNNVIASVLFLVALVGLVSFGFNKIELVKAEDGPGERPPVSLTTNIDKDAYHVGETIYAEATAQLGMCANTALVYEVKVNLDGGYNYTLADHNLDEQIIYGRKSFPVPTTIGEHRVVFTVYVDGASLQKTQTFYVLPTPSVTTFVDGEKSITINKGASADITWVAANATIGCTCTLNPATGSGVTSCGSSPANEIDSGRKVVTNITEPTTVTVNCSSSDYVPPTTTTTKVIGGLTEM